MLKKAIIAGAGALLVGLLLFGRDLWSYVSTSAGWVRETVKESVPITFEIDRARRMVHDLMPEIRKNMHLIAKEEVEVRQLEEQIARADERLAADRAGILRLRDDLASGQATFQYAGRSYTVSEVKLDLARRFERYKTAEATLASLRAMHEARLRSLEAARQKLEGMLAAKRQLEVDVEQLEARLKMVEAAQTTSEYNFDDSQLARAKELVRELRTRLEVAEKLVHAEDAFRSEIPLEEPAPENIVNEVTEYFQPASPALAEAGTRHQ